MEKKSGKGWIKILLVVLALGALFFLSRAFGIQDQLKRALDWVESLGPLAGVVFCLLYILATVFMIPGSVLTLGAGALFGVLWGSITVSIASILGATAAFLVGRYLARGWVSKKIEGNPKFKAIDEAVGREGWKIVGLTRLSPVFPFTLLNYSYGLTKVSLRDYFFASWIGMAPGTVMYVYLGSIAKTAADAAAGGAGKTPGEIALYVVGLVATIGVTVYVTKVARKALNEKVGETK